MTEGVGTGGDNIYALGPDSTVIQRRPLPLHWAALLALYLILAFAIMIAAKLIPVDHQAKLFFGKIGLDRIHDVFFRYSVAGGVIVPLIFFIEYCCVGWQKSSVRSILVQNPASGRSDFVCFLLNHLRLLRLPQIVLTFGLALITGEMVRAYFGRYFPAILSSDYLPQYVLYPVYFILYTILDYLAHRVDHSVYFWPLHRFHHAAEEFNVLTADRGHPASAFVQSTVKIFPLALLGVPPDALIDIGMLVVVINYLNHSRIDWDFGWFGRYVIQSPRHHQLHHSVTERVACNLSLCPLWDRLGGTWRDVTPAAVRLGTTSAPYRHGAYILPDVLRDYRDFLRGLVAGVANLFSGRRSGPAAATDVAAGGEGAAPVVVPLNAATQAGGTTLNG